MTTRPKRHGVQAVEEVHRLADDEGVDEHGQADRLAHERVDGEDGAGDGDGGRPVEDAEGLGQAHVEHVPGRDADVGADREIDAEAVEEQADERLQHMARDRAGRVVRVLSEYVRHAAASPFKVFSTCIILRPSAQKSKTATCTEFLPKRAEKQSFLPGAAIEMLCEGPDPSITKRTARPLKREGHSSMPKLSTRHTAPVRLFFWKEEQRHEREAAFSK